MPPRKPKNVTPDDELDIPEDVVAAIAKPAVASADETTAHPKTLTEVSRELVPLADSIRAAVADIALLPVARATPAQRTQMVDLREMLDAARRDLSTWVTAIDISFRRAALETNASEFALAEGVVQIEQKRGEWVVNVPALRDELKAFVAAGTLSPDEFEAIFKTKVEVVADNTKLNHLAQKRGDELADAISRNRTWKPGDPAAATVRIKRRTPA